MTNHPDYLSEFDDEVRASHSLPFCQIQNPPNLSLAKIQQYQSPWGIFIDYEQANFVEFQPTDDFQPIRLLFDEDTPQQREVDGWLTQHIRIAVIHRSAGIEVQQKTSKGWRYVGEAYHQGELTAAGLMAANNRETYRLWTRYLLLFLDERNQPLHKIPLRLGMNSGTGGSFGEEIKVFRQEIERVFFKLRQQSQKSLSDRAHALTVLDCQLGLHKNEKAPFVCPARRCAPAIDQVGVSKEVERRQGRRITLVGVPIQSLLIPKSSATGRLILNLWDEYRDFPTRFQDEAEVKSNKLPENPPIPPASPETELDF